MAHADPEDEGGDVEPPDLRVLEVGDAQTGIILIDLAEYPVREQQQGGEEDHPKERTRTLQTAQHILVDLRPVDILINIFGLGDKAPLNGDLCVVAHVVCLRYHYSLTALFSLQHSVDPGLICSRLIHARAMFSMIDPTLQLLAAFSHNLPGPITGQLLVTRHLTLPNTAY